MKPRKNKQKQSRALLPWRAAGCIVAMFCAGILLLGATEPDETEQNSRKKIESMSPAERAQLKRNYEKFQKLTPEEKARYRKIHEAIRKKPELNHVMRCYEDWVRTLSPWEQEDLRKAKTPEERMALIRKFRAEHSNSGRWKRYRESYDIINILKIDFKRNPRLLFVMRVQTPPPELFQQVIDIIEQSLPEPVKYPKPKTELTEYQRSLLVLQAAAQVKRLDDKKNSDWPQPEVVHSVCELLDKNRYHLFRESADLRGGPDNRRGENSDSPEFLSQPKIRQRAQVNLILAKGLLHQLLASSREQLAQIQIPEEQLQKFFETLDSKDKGDLLKHPPEELQERLRFMYLREHMTKHVRNDLRERATETLEVITSLAGSGDMGSFMDGTFRRGNGGNRPRFNRGNGPVGRGNRGPRGREPGDREPDDDRPRPPQGKPDA